MTLILKLRCRVVKLQTNSGENKGQKNPLNPCVP